MRRLSIILAAIVLIVPIAVQNVFARNYISIVGSSTVYPFATAVAERFGKTTPFKTPKVESTGSGGGLKLFSGGIGIKYPDIANASRAIKKSEIKACVKNGVTEIVEVKIGYDGIVLASSKESPPMRLSKREIFLALAKEIPDPNGENRLIPNPYKRWKEISPDLPDTRIEVLGPPPTSGTRDAFLELAMEGGAKSFDWIKAIKRKDKNLYKRIAHTIREDGAYIDAGENDNLIVQKLVTNRDTVGIFGFSFLDQNLDRIHGAIVEGVEPDFENIASQKYPLSRPLFFYVKKAHVGMIPGIIEYLKEFTSEKAWGPEGYLADKGLIPMPDKERAKMRETALKLVTIPIE